MDLPDRPLRHHKPNTPFMVRGLLQVYYASMTVGAVGLKLVSY
jgi:hypothetical protein